MPSATVTMTSKAENEITVEVDYDVQICRAEPDVGIMGDWAEIEIGDVHIINGNRARKIDINKMSHEHREAIYEKVEGYNESE